VSEWVDEPSSRVRRGSERAESPLWGARPIADWDWPESVRVVGFQPTLWRGDPESKRRTAPRATAQGPTIVEEIGQSFYLMGLMAAILATFVGLGLLAVHVLV